MKLNLLTPAVLLAAFSISAHAGTDMKDVKDVKQMAAETSDAGYYVGAYGGANFSVDYGNRNTVVSTGGTNTGATPDNIHTDIRGVGGVKIGYNFESFAVCPGLRLQPALETEGLYIGSQSNAHASVLGGGINTNTSYNSAAGFTNGIIRFKTDSALTPYLGVGVGVQYITTHSDIVAGGPGATHLTGLDGSDTDFAAQALAGVDYKIANHWSLFTEYKFIDALGTDIKDSNVGGTGSDLRFKPDQVAQQIGVIGVKYGF